VIRIRLPEAEAQELERAFRQATDRTLRDRLQIIRLAHRGRPHQDIAADLGITRRTVQRWLNRYSELGPAGLRPRKANGAQARIPPEMAGEIRRWVIEGPARQGLGRANGTHAELAEHLFCTHGIRASRSAMQRFCGKLDIRVDRPTYRFLRGDPEEQAKAREGLAALEKKAEAGELTLLSRDEAQSPMVPTLGPTPGVKGLRPTVGTRDCKDLLYVLAVIDVVTGVLRANTLESPAGAKRATAESETRWMQEAFAAHLRHVARLYPAAEHNRVVLILDNAPWHRGGPIDEALADCPHLEFYRLPSYSPQLNVIERSWKVLRRRATDNRLFDGLPGLKRTIRASLCYYQTMRGRVRSLIAGCYTLPAKQTPSPGV
jgi:transposase